MVWWDVKGRSLALVDFDRSRAIASLKSGEPGIPVWLDVIYEPLNNRLNERDESA
jgi:hypothetical protein